MKAFPGLKKRKNNGNSRKDEQARGAKGKRYFISLYIAIFSIYIQIYNLYLYINIEYIYIEYFYIPLYRGNISLVEREGTWNETMLCEKINISGHQEWREGENKSVTIGHKTT